MNARPLNRLAQLRSVSHALVSTLQKHQSKTSDHVRGSYVVNLFKQKVYHKKAICLFVTVTLHNNIFVIDSLTIFIAQIVDSHAY